MHVVHWRVRGDRSKARAGVRGSGGTGAGAVVRPVVLVERGGVVGRRDLQVGGGGLVHEEVGHRRLVLMNRTTCLLCLVTPIDDWAILAWRRRRRRRRRR